MSRETADLFDSWDSYRETCRDLSRTMGGRSGAQVRLAKKSSNLFRTSKKTGHQRLDVRRLQIRVLCQDLRRGHPVRDQVDDERHGDAHPTDTGASAHDAGSECDSIEHRRTL